MRLLLTMLSIVFLSCGCFAQTYYASAFVPPYPHITEDSVIILDVPLSFSGSVQPFIFDNPVTLSLQKDPGNPPNAYVQLTTGATLNSPTFTTGCILEFLDATQLKVQKSASIVTPNTAGGTFIFRGTSTFITLP